MQKYTTNQLRRLFLDFFAGKEHAVLPSAPLVPQDDPTLLWINAGMAPLKPYFSGQQRPANPRMANSQKCIRTNDIENVGKTARHHTFFEMLGSFSIGDYFKEETLVWGWEFLKDVIGLPEERMYATIHPEDEESRHIWLNVIGLPAERLVEDKENFWDIGPGPCGPNSEIYFDQGPEFGCDSPTCGVGCDCDRYLEVWNHVFSQFNHNEDGSYTPLPKKNIDTGMGLERLAAVVQGVKSNFETDVFQPIMQALTDISGHPYQPGQEHAMAFNVIADHIRAATFAIGDGALPSNEGRGYVIRRLLRRAVRYGKTLGLNSPLLYQLVGAVVQAMKDGYPELARNQEFVERVIRIEEERFHETLDEGVSLLNSLITDLKAAGKDELAGKEAFRLYDTFGFPFDLTEDIAREQGIRVDHDGFKQAMAEQRERARAARAGIESSFGKQGIFNEVAGGNVFIGYTATRCPAHVLAIASDENLVSDAAAGQEVGLLVDQTVFYAEGGGQVSDIGEMTGEGVKLQVNQVSKVAGDKILHHCLVLEGRVQVGQKLVLQIDIGRRQAVQRAHSATHLVHRALMNVLGDHVHQAGSLVEADHLRFDFSHFSPLTADEMQQVEWQVNQQILCGSNVVAEEMSLDAARAKGAVALFGEKYGDQVRVVSMGDYSIELCGGTHVSNVGMIGQFRLLSEGGIGAGLRRLEAITGEAAYRHALEQEERLAQVAALLKVKPEDSLRRVEQVLNQLRSAEREVETLLSRQAAQEVDTFLAEAAVVKGVTVVARQVMAKDMDSLRQIADTVKDKLPSGVIVLGAVVEDKVNLVAMVSDDLVKQKLHAGKLIKEVAQITGGGGGGRPQMAQAGGKDPSKLAQALDIVPSLVEQQL